MPITPRYLNKADAATYTGYSVATIERFIDAGLLPARRVGEKGHVRIDRNDLDTLLGVEGVSA